MYFFVVCGLCGRFVRREDKFPLIMYTTAKVPHGDQAGEHGENSDFSTTGGGRIFACCAAMSESCPSSFPVALFAYLHCRTCRIFYKIRQIFNKSVFVFVFDFPKCSNEPKIVIFGFHIFLFKFKFTLSGQKACQNLREGERKLEKENLCVKRSLNQYKF